MMLEFPVSSTGQNSVPSANEIRIAVLSSDFSSTAAWIMNTFKVKEANLMRRRFLLEDGKVMYIVSDFAQAYGMRFTEYVKAPNYFTLEDVVRSRCY